jgi:integrase
MAKITFQYRGTKETGNLTIRLIHGKEIDIKTSSAIQSKKEYWLKRTTKNGKTTNRHLKWYEISNSINGAVKHKEELKKIEKDILDKLIIDSNKGEPIEIGWLKKTVSEFTLALDTKKKIKEAIAIKENKEEKEGTEKERIYKINLLSSAVKKMFVKYASNPDELKKYKVTLNFLLKFQEHSKREFTILDLGNNFAQLFINWSLLEMEYSKSYTNAQLKRLRSSAVNTYEGDDENIVKTSKTLRSFDLCKDIYKGKIVVTLGYKELDKIDDTIIENERLLDAKRALLIGCETGLRYSDMNKLVDENIKRVVGVKYWKFRTQKTDAIVQITITNRILYLIDKYGLPKTNYPDNGVKLNLNIKKVCSLSGIDEEIKGSKAVVKVINGKKQIRNNIGLHEKHLLITSRTFRRSFATNYFGKIDTSLIMVITGHSTEKQLRGYISNNEETNIKSTKEQIDKFHQKREYEKQQAKENPTMVVIRNALNQ